MSTYLLATIKPFLTSKPILYYMTDRNYYLMINSYKFEPLNYIDSFSIYYVNNLFTIYLAFKALKFLDDFIGNTRTIKIANDFIITSEDLKDHLQLQQDSKQLQIKISSNNDSIGQPNAELKYNNVFTDLEFNNLDDGLDHLFLKTYDYLTSNIRKFQTNFKQLDIFESIENMFNENFSVLRLVDYVLEES